MTITNINKLCAFIILIFAASIQAADKTEANIKVGEAAFQTCRGCHSIPGYSNAYPTFYVPKIGGQRAEYVVSALKAYQAGDRPHGTMTANAYDLSETTMKQIGAYVQQATSKQRMGAASGDPAKGKDLAQACLGCHTKDLDAGGNTPILAGQYGNYLVRAMQGYQTGKRKNPIMQSMLKDMSKQDLKDISAYFAYMKGLTEVK